jgi:hypothetical protein
MKKISKIMYGGMFISTITTLIISLSSEEYSKAGWVFNTLIWVSIALMNELNYIKLENYIKDLYTKIKK